MSITYILESFFVGCLFFFFFDCPFCSSSHTVNELISVVCSVS